LFSCNAFTSTTTTVSHVGISNQHAAVIKKNNINSDIFVLKSFNSVNNDHITTTAENNDISKTSGWWSFSFPDESPSTTSSSSKLELPSLELPSAIKMIQETHRKYLRSHQIVKKRRVFRRLIEITTILSGEILRPVLCSIVKTKPDLSTIHIPTDEDWDIFWTQKRGRKQLSNAERIAKGIPALGPTFVKLALILATRPDILPVPLAEALGEMSYNVPPFDDLTAKRMIRTDMKTALLEHQQQHTNTSSSSYLQNLDDVKTFMDALSEKPVATGGVAQVYKGYLPGYGEVAVKVLRPGVRRKVERDATLFHSFASWAESISNNTMKLPGMKLNIGSIRLVAAVDEFTSQIFEDIDFNREIANAQAFSMLYDYRKGTSPNVKVVVPEVVSELSSDRVIVMEWLEGTKLTDICSGCEEQSQVEKENLDLIVQAIEMTVSQIIDHGLIHGDPHLGNVLKVRNPVTGKPEIGYLDFGLVSYVPQQYRDAIVCAVVQLVFARNLEAVADLCGELGLLPQETLQDAGERKRLLDALQRTIDDILIWPKNKRGMSTSVPTIRFENMLPAMSKFITQFQFTMPPYFLNNIRALATLEGMALKLDPDFNVLRIIYPYSINRLMRNPTVSKKVQDTFLEICRNPQTKLISPRRVSMLINDWALWTGYRKRKIFWDLLTSAGGRRVAPVIFKNFVLNRVRNVRGFVYRLKYIMVSSWHRILNKVTRRRMLLATQRVRY
jgi:predicted unusual protein kinase regulating ubiquinone biosynthesis (AarF/ABC1/UbiB family)